MRYPHAFIRALAGALVCALSLVAPADSEARQGKSPRGRALQPPGGTVEARIACGTGSVARSFVYIPGQSFSAITTDTGQFRLSYVPAGTYVIRVEIPDKPVFAIPNVVVIERQTTDLGVVEFCPPPPQPEPIVLEPLPQTLETAQAAVNFLLGGEIEVPVNCGGVPAINCPNGNPLSPAPRLSVQPTAVSVTQTDAGYPFSSTLGVRTLTDIAVTVPGVGECALTIDTAPGPSPVVTVTGTMMFGSHEPGGPVNRIGAINVQVSGLTSDDVSLGGGLGCDLATFGLSFFMDAVTNTVSDHLENGACGAAGPELFIACP